MEEMENVAREMEKPASESLFIFVFHFVFILLSYQCFLFVFNILSLSSSVLFSFHVSI